MQHVDRLRELNRINRPVSPARILLRQLPDACAQPLPGLGARWLTAVLHRAQVVTHGPDHALWEAQQIPLRRANPVKRLLVRRRPGSHGLYLKRYVRSLSCLNERAAVALTGERRHGRLLEQRFERLGTDAALLRARRGM